MHPKWGTQYIKQLITKEVINSNTIIVRDFSTPLQLMDRSYKQKINRETVVSNDTLGKIYLIDVF